MSIIDEKPTQPTTAQQALDVANGIKNLSTDIFNQMVNTFNGQMQQVWQNQQGLTPLEILQAFGTDAQSLFATAVATITYINTVVPGTITNVNPPMTPQFNSDGSILSLS